MKRILPLVLVLLTVLCGCNSQPEATAAPTEPPVADSLSFTEPTGIYLPDSQLEEATNGAVRMFPLGRLDSIGFLHMGNDLLLFSGAGGTTLTKYSGDALCVSAAANLNCCIFPWDPAVHADKDGVTYYDERQNDLVFLDAALQEAKRIALPETICGAPALTADRSKLYYCTGDALRCIDLDSGLDRLLKEMFFADQSVSALHCDDTIIVCSASDEDGTVRRLYIDTRNGLLLNETFDDTDVWTLGSTYFAIHQDGIYEELLTGDSEQGPTLLTPDTFVPTAYPALEAGGAVLVSEYADDGALRLDYYDLRNGRRSASLTLNGCEPIWSLRAAAQSPFIWFLRYDPRYECEVLHRWDLSQTPTEDKTSHLSARYTAENPDISGIAACREIADTLCEVYGVQILLWTDATGFEPWDYTLVPEYQVPVIRRELAKLENILGLYPEGFLKKAAEATSSDHIQICLVRSILGNDSADGSLSEVVGLQYWDDHTNAYLSLSAQSDSVAQSACHELFHIIDSRVMSVCKAYDDWDKLNPKGFRYDNDYVANLTREDAQWLEGANRAFIDTYSMSYPKEDRARIMEYAMMPGNEALFESEIMQKKLRQLCIGIREAFGLKRTTETLLWEQYLKEPLK